MRITIEKYNPNHDERGRFAAVESRIDSLAEHKGGRLSVGKSPLATAKNFKKLQDAHPNHPLDSFTHALTSISYAHDVPFNTAKEALQRVGFDKDKGNSALHSAKLWGKYPETHPLRTSKPSSPTFQKHLPKLPQGLVTHIMKGSGHIFKDEGDLFANASKLDPKTPYKDIIKQSKHFQSVVRHVMWGTSMSPATRDLAVKVGQYFNRAKVEYGKMFPKPAKEADGQDWNLDHVKPKGMFVANSDESIKWVNRVGDNKGRNSNFQWKKDKDNKSKGDGLLSKEGKLNWKTLEPNDIKFMSYEALYAHHLHEKHTGHSFKTGTKGPAYVTKAVLNKALKEGRSKDAFLKKHGKKASSPYVWRVE